MTDQARRAQIGAAQERTVFFTVGDDELFGVITEPERPNGHGVLIIQGGDTVNISLMRNRMAVSLARALAAEGYVALRFDYHGLGESSGVIGELSLANPFAADAIAAVECLRHETGVGPVFLLGACFSSRTALSAAVELPEVAGLVLATPPSANFDRSDGSAERMARDRAVGDYVTRAMRFRTLKNLRDPKLRRAYWRLVRSKVRHLFNQAKSGSGESPFWVSDDMLDQMGEMVRRRVPQFIAFGTDDPELREFERAEAGRLGAMTGDSSELIRVVRDLPGVIHGFPQVDGQEAFSELAIEWIKAQTPAQS